MSSVKDDNPFFLLSTEFFFFFFWGGGGGASVPMSTSKTVPLLCGVGRDILEVDKVHNFLVKMTGKKKKKIIIWTLWYQQE